MSDKQNEIKVGKKRTKTDIEKEQDEQEMLIRRPRLSDETVDIINQENHVVAGKVKKIKLYNFMCHGHMEFNLGDRINFLSGKNGSGKSAILTALVIGLGGRTSDTNRGNSMKNLIKNGQNAGSIEITLNNEGEFAYNEEQYGKEITILRKISDKASTYKFLSETGKVVVSKKNELSFILKSFNIQINNPICILNQDVARTFLKSTTPPEFYRLFRKGTSLEYLIDRVNIFLSERLPYLMQLHSKDNENVHENCKELKEFKEKKEKQQEIHDLEKYHESVKKELVWSFVLSLEKDIETEKKVIEEYEQTLQNINTKVQQRDTIVGELKTNRKTFEDKINNLKTGNLEKGNARLQLGSELAKTKELVGVKIKEIRRLEKKKEHAVKNCNEIESIIANQEKEANKLEEKRNEIKLRKEELKKKYDELKAVLSTSEVHRQQLSDTVNSCNKNMSHKKRFIDNLGNTIKHKEQYLMSLKKGKNELSVYASWMPDFIEAIKRAHEKGKFEQMPRGPLGAYIKLKEADWGPAIESLLKGGMLRSFCVHSSHDYKVIDSIMNSLNIPKKQRPSVTISKFLPKVHDVSNRETRSSKYVSLLRLLSISDVVVANSLIDQCQIERVLLIPTNAEAYPLMEDIKMVPVNCQRALTKTGDLFFPQPTYKSYSGTVSEQARFLQVNPESIIKLTEEEIKSTRDEYKTHQQQMQELEKKYLNARKGLDEAEKEVRNLTSKLANCELKINDIEQEDIPESFDANVLADDVKHWKGNIASCENTISEATQAKDDLMKKGDAIKAEMDKIDNEENQRAEVLQETERELNNAKKELQKVTQNHDYYINLLKSEKRKLESHQNKLEQLEKEHEEAKKDAEEVCPERIGSPGEVDHLKKKQTEVFRMIKALKELFEGELIEPADFQLRMENFEKSLTEVQMKGDVLKIMREISDRIPKQIEELSIKVGENTDRIFQNILGERNFVGKLEIDHTNQRLNIIIQPDPKAKSKCPISTLSGGERSFSMVAFMIALWDNMSSPFYFMDEFDVFMDEVNRKIVMDLLISTAKSRPKRQFVFLTPHSTVAEDSPIINFFRMKDPREDLNKE